MKGIRKLFKCWIQVPVLFLFNSNAAHLSGKLPAKQERKHTIAKSPQLQRGRKERNQKEGRNQPISTACYFTLSQLAPSLTSHSSFNNTYTWTPTLSWHLSALWIHPSWKVKSQRSMRLIKKNVGFSASENERHHKKSKGQWSLLFLIFLSWLIIFSDKKGIYEP